MTSTHKTQHKTNTIRTLNFFTECCHENDMLAIDWMGTFNLRLHGHRHASTRTHTAIIKIQIIQFLFSLFKKLISNSQKIWWE